MKMRKASRVKAKVRAKTKVIDNLKTIIVKAKMEIGYSR